MKITKPGDPAKKWRPTVYHVECPNCGLQMECDGGDFRTGHVLVKDDLHIGLQIWCPHCDLRMDFTYQAFWELGKPKEDDGVPID